MPPRSNLPGALLLPSFTSGLNYINHCNVSIKQAISIDKVEASGSNELKSLALLAVRLRLVPVTVSQYAAGPYWSSNQWTCLEQHEGEYLVSSSNSSIILLLLLSTCAKERCGIAGAEKIQSHRFNLHQIPFVDEIMSLQQNHHHQHHLRQQQQQATSSAQNTVSTNNRTVITTTAPAQPQCRSSSTSPTHQNPQTRYFTQRHHYQQQFQHQYLPPRPPSTTSSGSVSTCGFPDDLQDELPLSNPQDSGGAGAGATTSTTAGSAVYAFHPAHNPLLYQRHTSPHISTQHHHLQQQHCTIQSHSHQSHMHHPPHDSSVSVEHPFCGGGGTGGGTSASGSRTASRTTFIADEDDAGGVLEKDNLLLVDNSVGVQDAVYLDPVTTDNFLTNVVQRFKRDFIYTYVGEGALLVSVNPYKPLSIFSPRVKAAYRNISNPFQLPPHMCVCF